MSMTMDTIVYLTFYVAGIIPFVTTNCPAVDSCLKVLNDSLRSATTPGMVCGCIIVYRNCIETTEVNCDLDLTNTKDNVYEQFPLCRIKRSEICPQKTHCHTQFKESTTSDRCLDSRTYENCLYRAMQSCDLVASDLDPAIAAVANHCSRTISIFTTVEGVDSLGKFLKTLLKTKGGLFPADGSVCKGPNQCISQSTTVIMAFKRKTHAEICSSLRTTQTCLDQEQTRCTSRDAFFEMLLDVSRSEIETLCQTQTGCARLSECSSLVLSGFVNRNDSSASCSLVRQVHACFSSARILCPFIPQVSMFRLQRIINQCDTGLYINHPFDGSDVTTSAGVTTTTAEYLGDHVDMALVGIFRQLMSLIHTDTVSTCTQMMSCIPSNYDYINDLIEENYERFCQTMGKMHFCLSVVASSCTGISSELHRAMRQSRQNLFEACKPIGAAVAGSSSFSSNWTLWLILATIGCTCITTYLN